MSPRPSKTCTTLKRAVDLLAEAQQHTEERLNILIQSWTTVSLAPER